MKDQPATLSYVEKFAYIFQDWEKSQMLTFKLSLQPVLLNN